MSTKNLRPEMIAGEPVSAQSASTSMALRKLAGPVLVGLISVFPPSSVLSLLNVQKATGVLYLQNRSLHATIHVENGEVVGATMGSEQGVPALFYALSWNTGR